MTRQGDPDGPDHATSEPGWLAVAGECARLAVKLHAARGVIETAQAAMEHAISALGASYAGLIVGEPGNLEIAAVTDQVIDQLCELAADEDPLIEAFAERSMVLIDDTTIETSWPAWQELAVHVGIRTVLHLPLLTTDERVGVLSIYHVDAEAFSDDDITTANLIARHTAVALASARTRASLAQAADSRRIIGQAVGILMERHHTSEHRAFAVLRQHSQNTKLRDTATQLVQTRHLPE